MCSSPNVRMGALHSGARVAWGPSGQSGPTLEVSCAARSGDSEALATARHTFSAVFILGHHCLPVNTISVSRLLGKSLIYRKRLLASHYSSAVTTRGHLSWSRCVFPRTPHICSLRMPGACELSEMRDLRV